MRSRTCCTTSGVGCGFSTMIIAGLSSVPLARRHAPRLCQRPENGMRRLGFGRVSVRTTHSNRFAPGAKRFRHRKNDLVRHDPRVAGAEAISPTPRMGALAHLGGRLAPRASTSATRCLAGVNRGYRDHDELPDRTRARPTIPGALTHDPSSTDASFSKPPRPEWPWAWECGRDGRCRGSSPAPPSGPGWLPWRARTSTSRTPTTSSAGSSTASSSMPTMTTLRRPHSANLHRPPFEIASLYIEQTPEATDLGRAKARKHGVRLSPTIADALTLGTGKLAVDAVLLIAEHGDYPLNAKLQKLYPRGRYFRQVLDVFRASGRSVPVFIDKHLVLQPGRGPADGRPGPGLEGPAHGRLEPAGHLAAASPGDPPGPHLTGGPRRLARRPRDLRLPRPGNPPVHGRAARPQGQAPGREGRDLPGRRRRLEGRRRGRLVVGAAPPRPRPQPHPQPRRHPAEHPRLRPARLPRPATFLSGRSPSWSSTPTACAARP